MKPPETGVVRSLDTFETSGVVLHHAETQLDTVNRNINRNDGVRWIRVVGGLILCPWTRPGGIWNLRIF